MMNYADLMRAAAKTERDYRTDKARREARQAHCAAVASVLQTNASTTFMLSVFDPDPKRAAAGLARSHLYGMAAIVAGLSPEAALGMIRDTDPPA